MKKFSLIALLILIIISTTVFPKKTQSTDFKITSKSSITIFQQGLLKTGGIKNQPPEFDFLGIIQLSNK